MRIPSTRKNQVLIGFNVVLDLERSYKRTLLHFTVSMMAGGSSYTNIASALGKGLINKRQH
jgi:hypothetical protein